MVNFAVRPSFVKPLPDPIKTAIDDLADKCQWLGSALRGGKPWEQDAALVARSAAYARLQILLGEALNVSSH